MINSIINGILNFVIGMVNLVLLPIDTIIDRFLPSVDSALSYVSTFFGYIGDFIPWIISWFNLPLWFLQFVFYYVTFRLSVFLVVSSLKTILAWYNVLKP